MDIMDEGFAATQTTVKRSTDDCKVPYSVLQHGQVLQN